MDLSLDIFRNDAFSFAALQRMTANIPYIPTLIGQMGLFEDQQLTGTDMVILYEEDGNIRLIPATERGAPDVWQQRDQGRFYALKTVRLAKADTMRASELLSVANMALPETVRMRNGMEVLNRRTAKLKADMAATKELHRLGALQGKLMDADGTTVLVDFATKFGITLPATLSVDFDNMPAEQFIMYWQTNILVPMQLALKNRWIEGRTRVGALVGDAFWAKLMTHPGFRDLYKQLMNAQAIARAMNPTMEPNNWQTINFAGIEWTNYRGSTSGEISIPTNYAKFFPINASGVYQVFWAPGETLDQVQAPGQPEYTMIQPDVRSAMVSHVDVFHRAYPLYACTFPKCLMSAKIAGT